MWIVAFCLAAIATGFLWGVWWCGRGDSPTLTDLSDQLAEVRFFMADANARIEAATAAIKAALSNIAADIAKIKANVEAGVPTENTLAALEAVQANAEALAAENPDAN